MRYIREFTINPNTFSQLTPDERAALPQLVLAIKRHAEIYSKQENPKYLGANFYPHDATKLEIEQAAAENPTILSPYTYVIRDAKGRLTTIPYWVMYRNTYRQVAELLLRASIAVKAEDFSLYLQSRAHALTDGSYQEADTMWLTSRLFPINVMVGPIERYDDRLFFRKCASRGWISILNRDLTEEANRFRDVMYKAHRPIRYPSQVSFLDKIRVRVDDPLLFGGQIAKNMVISTNLPNDARLMQQHGSIITIFSSVIMERFDQNLLPLYMILFSDSFRKEYPLEIIRRAALRHAYWHELAHPLGRYLDAEERLKDHFPIFDELFATITGAKSAGTLFIKDFISQKELEVSVIILLLQAYYSYLEVRIRPGRIAYMQGYALAVNYLLESGSVKESHGKLWPNFAKMYGCLEELSRLLEGILAHGSYEQADALVSQFVKPEVFERSSRSKKVTRMGEL